MKTLKINDNWRIEVNNDNCELIHSEEKERKGVPYIAESGYNYPTVYHCLKKYLLLAQSDAKNVEEVVLKTDKALEELKSVC